MYGYEFHAGLGEDAVDEIDALRCGQEWTVLGVIVEVSHEGVEAGEGDAEVPGADDRRVRGYLLAEQIEIGSDDAIDVDAVPPTRRKPRFASLDYHRIRGGGKCR